MPQPLCPYPWPHSKLSSDVLQLSWEGKECKALVIGILTLCDVANELGVHVTNFATVGLRSQCLPRLQT